MILQLRWWVCRCGRRLYEHSARTRPNTGGREYICTHTASGRYEPETLPAFDFEPDRGVFAR